MVVLRTQVRSRKREKMVFPSEQEQIEKFEKDHVAQHYFEVLRTLISQEISLCPTGWTQGGRKLSG